MNQQPPLQYDQPQQQMQERTLWQKYCFAAWRFRISIGCCILIVLCSFSSCAGAPVVESLPTPTSSQHPTSTPYPASTPYPTSTQHPTSTPFPSFKGIIQFKGEDDPNGASNPYLAGADVTFYWSQLEPQKGQYNWDVVDRAMKPWIDHGKKIILRVSTSGWTRWHPPYSWRGTPQWVYDLGVPSITETDGSVIPQYWSSIFLQSLSDFTHAFAARYDGKPNIAYIQVAVGIGGETKVDSHNDNPQLLQLWQSIGYTDELWWNAVQQIITMYTASFHATPLAIMPDKTFIGKTPGYRESLLLDYAVKHGLWLQDNGLAANRTLPAIWMTVPHAEEQIAPTKQTGDTLLADLQTALNLGANYILVFTSDIDNPANQSALQRAASLTHQ